MNTLFVMMGAGAILWLSIYAFDTLGEPMLGVVILGAFFGFMIFTIQMALVDWQKISGSSDDGGDE